MIDVIDDLWLIDAPGVGDVLKGCVIDIYKLYKINITIDKLLGMYY
jgi:hypothetical protein